MTELAQSAPLAFLEEILPAMHLAMQRCAQPGDHPVEDSIWYWRNFDRSETRLVDVLDLVRDALVVAAQSDPKATARLLAAIEPERFATSLHLLLEAVSANGTALHPLLTGQLGNPGLFEAGWHHAPAIRPERRSPPRCRISRPGIASLARWRS